MNKIIIIAGPTAVGKTSLSLKLAKILNTDIISADSMQIYKYMNIGTAKISSEEMNGIKHHILDIIEPNQAFSVDDYSNLAKIIIKELHTKGKIPIIVGGTGLYINSLIYNLEFCQVPKDQEYRSYLENLAVKNGNPYIYDMLKEVDPVYADTIHYNQIKRAIRALEVYRHTGTPFSKQNSNKTENKAYKAYYYYLNRDRKDLYDAINKRVDQMFNLGLLDEFKELLNRGYSQDLQSMKAIGYKELFELEYGKKDFESTKELIKQNSRHYAKRQLTWFRNDINCKEINTDKYDIKNILNFILEEIKEKDE